MRCGISSIENEEGTRPHVTYTDEGGVHELVCDYIAGCDADHGVSRASIPDGGITTYTYEFGLLLARHAGRSLGFLALLSWLPVTMAFVAQIPRGPQKKPFTTCSVPSSDSASDWPDDRVWERNSSAYR